MLASLEEVRHQVERALGDPKQWKWAIIAMCSALNGALVCHLTGSAGIGALNKKCAVETLKALNDDKPEEIPKPWLAYPKTLLQRSQRREQPDTRIESAGPQIMVSKCQKTAFDTLFDFRNELIHYKPSGWSIEVSGFPSLFWSCLEIILRVNDAGYGFRHLTQEEAAKLERTVADLERLLRTK